MMSIDYTVEYSNRRTIGITVERDGSVVVRAPRGASHDQIRSLVKAKDRWIREKIEDPQKYAPSAPPGKELVSGESLMYLGRNYRIEVVETDELKVEFGNGFRIPRVSRPQARQICREWYVRKAEDRLVPQATDWAKRLGVPIPSISIVDVRYRWGSCTQAGNVRLNWRLIKAPSHVIDYVIVHELAHLLEPNHGDRFWSIVRSQLAKVDASRTWLKENGQLLEQDL